MRHSEQQRRRLSEEGRQIRGTAENAEHLVNYRTTQVSKAGLSVKDVPPPLRDRSECHRNVMHLLPQALTWRPACDWVERERYPRHLMLTHSFHHLTGSACVITAPSSECLRGEEIVGNPPLRAGKLTLIGISIEMRHVVVAAFWIRFGPQPLWRDCQPDLTASPANRWRLFVASGVLR